VYGRPVRDHSLYSHAVVVAAQPLDTWPARFMSWFALVVVLATDLAYLLVIRRQNAEAALAGGAPDAFTVPFVAAYLLVVAALLAASLVRR
jgi:hypothetical protein